MKIFLILLLFIGVSFAQYGQSNCEYWFIAGNSANTITADSMEILADSSGNNRDLTNATSSKRPAYNATGFNGLATMTFDGVDDFLAADLDTLVQPFTVYMFIKKVSYTNNDRIWSSYSSALGMQGASNTAGTQMYAGTAWGCTNTDTTSNEWKVISFVANGASSQIRVNKGTATTGNPGSNNLYDGLVLCAYNAAGNNPGNFEVAEVLVFSDVHNDATIGVVVDSLDAKYSYVDDGLYYIDADKGNDDYTGYSPIAAKASFDSVNTAGITLDADDFVYLRTGDTWRETLTVPSSGTSGNPITFTCYDSTTGLTGAAALALGDTVTISGADLVTTWTASSKSGIIDESFEGAGYELSWTENVQAGCTCDEDHAGPGSLPVAGGSQCAKLIIIDSPNMFSYTKHTDNAEESLTYTRFYFYIDDTSGFANTEQKMIFRLYKDFNSYPNIRFYIYNDGGDVKVYPYVRSAPGTFLTLTKVAINFDTWYLVEFRYDNDNNQFDWKLDGQIHDEDTALGSPVDSEDYIFGPCAADGQFMLTYYVDLLKVSDTDWVGAEYVNIYQAAVTTEPNQVFFNSTRGTKESSIVGCNVANEWYWDSNVLYIYSETGSDTSSIEASQRDYCINLNSKDYIDVSYLHLKYANVDGILISGDNSNLKYCKIEYSATNNVTISGASNSVYYNLILNATTDGIGISGVTNTIYNNVLYGNDNGFDVDTSVTIRNNIVRTSGTDDINIATSQTVTGGYNVFEDAAKAGAGTYSGTSLWSTDPLFTDTANDDFTLQTKSPCIDAGTSVGLVLDYAGNTVPAPVNKRLVDIGAYEYSLSFGYKMQLRIHKNLQDFRSWSN